MKSNLTKKAPGLCINKLITIDNSRKLTMYLYKLTCHKYWLPWGLTQTRMRNREARRQVFICTYARRGRLRALRGTIIGHWTHPSSFSFHISTLHAIYQSYIYIHRIHQTYINNNIDIFEISIPEAADWN